VKHVKSETCKSETCKSETCKSEKCLKRFLPIILVNQMLFMNKTGQYVEILRKNYSSDTAYYTAIMKLRGYEVSIPTAVNLLPLGMRI
jgi:hypothetical protein